MQEFLLIILAVILLFRVARRFIFVNSYQGFQRAAEDFMKKQQEKNVRKPEGSVTVQDPGNGNKARHNEGEYVDYEEVR
jgi:hypothetical protein